jgi:hypothetical protein
MIQQDVQKFTEKVEFKTISNVAYSFAKFLADKENRKIIRDDISSSKKIENILEATELLNAVKKIKVDGKINDGPLIDVLETYIPVNEKADFRAKISSLEFGQLDIYLPLEEWRKNWNSEEEILIAAVDYRNSGDENEILAYNSNGDKLYLSAKEPPEIPTLVVYPSEKRGKYFDSENSDFGVVNKKNDFSSLNKITTTQFEYRVKTIFTNKNWDDGWFGGWMEIYIKYRSKPRYFGTWNSWDETSTVNDVHRGIGKSCNLFLDSYTDPLVFNIEMWEWDSFLNGGNDQICNIYYNKVEGSDGNSTGYNTVDIYNETGGTDFRTLYDGTNPSSEYYDWIQTDLNTDVN